MLHRGAGSDVNHSRDGRGSQDLAPLPPGVRAGPGEAEGRRAGGPQSAEKNGGASCQTLRSPTSATRSAPADRPPSSASVMSATARRWPR
ncbi:hypothetical protein B7R87_14300 [Streptomyces tsukubensis]|uniref:Uncharacterized protein n=1 Tax=Streptomyces tsukubensis (strain DSM 42081 / NBRC 108919 / NRRL 18488 / 9993) TaxID=1114943 RepID=A0A7G3UF32_STRT9|nr:hypothetical protein B7R87_14300 [Streptomyces tsukubensis]QKM69013.1 hypothetical protein STSU_019475 [Streptomyces tsukubensis NRRL18488]